MVVLRFPKIRKYRAQISFIIRFFLFHHDLSLQMKEMNKLQSVKGSYKKGIQNFRTHFLEKIFVPHVFQLKFVDIWLMVFDRLFLKGEFFTVTFSTAFTRPSR